jgi:hypothetical protein
MHIRRSPTAALVGLALALAACAGPSYILTGDPRPPIDPGLVRIYSRAPEKYQEIAIVEASSRNTFTFGDQAMTNAMIDRLKKEAAQLGANGLVIMEIGEGSSSSVGVGTSTTVGMGGIGVGVSAPMSAKYGRATAIYVPNADVPPPTGTAVPPSTGTNVPPSTGAAVPPSTGTAVPPPTGTNVSPPTGTAVPPPAGGGNEAR